MNIIEAMRMTGFEKGKPLPGAIQTQPRKRKEAGISWLPVPFEDTQCKRFFSLIAY
jgi:hypothetical protein